MATTYTSTLQTYATAGTRYPKQKVIVDFTDLGFSASSLWTDISSDVISIRGEQRALGMGKSLAALGRGVSSSCSITLRNPEDTGSYSGLRYSPSNPSSSLYAYIGDGQIHMKRARVELGFSDSTGASIVRVPAITGYIVASPERYKDRQITLEIRDRGSAATFVRDTTAVYTDVKPKTYMEALAAYLTPDAVATADQVFDDGMQAIAYAWLDDETAWEEMGIVAESQCGRVWFDNDGDLHFDDGTHFVRATSSTYDDPTTSQFTFSTDDFNSLDPTYDYRSIWNDITVEYQPRYEAESQTIYTGTETIMIPPAVTFGTYRTKAIRCDFRYPVVGTPSSTITATNAAGTTVSVTEGIAEALSTYYATNLRNSSNKYAAYVVQFELTGTPLLTEQSNTYNTTDATSIDTYGRRTWRVRNPYIQTYRHAQMVGDLLLARFKDPVQFVRLSGVRGVPWLEVGDRITITETLTGIDEDYFITELAWSWSVTGGYIQDITAVRASDLFPYSDYFVVATSTYGNGSGANDGRLFW